jgi:hypothetical protein
MAKKIRLFRRSKKGRSVSNPYRQSKKSEFSEPIKKPFSPVNTEKIQNLNYK